LGQPTTPTHTPFLLPPAVEVFSNGIARYPRSARLEIGRGIALYGLAISTSGAKAFFQASDVDAADPLPLLFLARLTRTFAPSN